MLWQSNASPRPPTTSALLVPGAEAVRQAALEASWRRDKRVAQRRLFWRWTLWYIQRFYAHALVCLTMVVGAVYFSDRWFGGPLPSWATFDPPAHTPAVVSQTPPTSAASTSESLAPTDPHGWVAEPVRLHASQHLDARRPRATASPAPSGLTDILPLKPENWLHSKEP